MTITVYRITKRRYQDQIFAGIGGLYADGRWTPRGRLVVYTSASISLAVLEYTLNYRRRGWVPPSVLGRATLPADMSFQTIQIAALPHHWSSPDSPPELRDIGQEWLEQGVYLALKVPSAIVPEEWNYLLNPQHPDFKRLAFGASEPFAFDRRLARTRRRS